MRPPNDVRLTLGAVIAEIGNQYRMTELAEAGDACITANGTDEAGREGGRTPALFGTGKTAAGR